MSVEMDQERPVLRIRQHLIEKFFARAPFLIQHAAHTAACIHQQSQGQRKLRVQLEVLNRLRPSIFRKREIVLSEIRDEFPVLVPHRHRQRHHLHIHLDRWRIWRGLRLRGSGLSRRTRLLRYSAYAKSEHPNS